jgi:hypothetical protein
LDGVDALLVAWLPGTDTHKITTTNVFFPTRFQHFSELGCKIDIHLPSQARDQQKEGTKRARCRPFCLFEFEKTPFCPAGVEGGNAIADLLFGEEETYCELQNN